MQHLYCDSVHWHLCAASSDGWKHRTLYRLLGQAIRGFRKATSAEEGSSKDTEKR